MKAYDKCAAMTARQVFSRRPRRTRRLIVLLLSSALPLFSATMEDGLALKRAEDFPGAAKVFSELVSANPNDVDALEQFATVTGWMNRHAEALALWDRAIGLAPKYLELRVSRARVLYWMGRLPEADAAISEMLPLLPNDPDAHELAGDIARARHDAVRARALYQQTMVLNPASTAEKKAAALTMPKRWRQDAGGMLDFYHPASATVVQRGHEQTAYMQLGRQVSESVTLAVGSDYVHQFGEVDWRYNGEAYWTPTPEWSFQARAAVTPQAEVLANWEGLLGVDWQATTQVAGLLNVRTADFSAERIVTFMPGIRWGETTTIEARIFYTISDVNPDTNAAMVKVATNIAERWQPYVLVSYGEENQPPVGVAKTASGVAGVTVQVSNGLSLRLDGLYEWREDIHQRVSLGGGFTLRF